MKYKIMPDTIFPVELPKKKEELEKIKQEYSFSEYDPDFIAAGCNKEIREKFNKWWANFKPYADSDFLSKVKEKFHQRSWEIYVGNVLLKKEQTIVEKLKNEGPDFIIDKIAYIECVAPEKGNSDNSVPEMVVAKKDEEIQFEPVPVDKMILRITSVIKEKVEKYEKWNKKNGLIQKCRLSLP